MPSPNSATLPINRLWPLVDLLQTGVIIVNRDLTICYWNQWLSRFSGLSSEMVLNQSLEAVFPELDDTHLLGRLEHALEFNLPAYISHLFSRSPLPLYDPEQRSDPKPRILQEFHLQPYTQGTTRLCLIQINDVSRTTSREALLKQQIQERKEAERHLNAERNLFISGPTVILKWIYEANTPVTYISPNVLEQFGYQSDDFITRRIGFTEVIHPDDRARVMQQITENLLLGQTSFEREYRVKHGDGSYRWVYDHTVALINEDLEISQQFIGYLIDITDRKEVESQIEFMAFHDPLTGLANRRLLLNILQRAIVHAQRHQQFGAIFYLDLDRFKLINDSLGHDVGDLLLKEVAHRLTATLRAEDSAARIGGDEFVLVLSHLHAHLEQAHHHVKQIAAKLVTTLSQPYTLLGHQVQTTPSIGIALFPNNGHTAERLMKYADDAMYQVKRAGRCGYQISVEDPDLTDSEID